MKMEIIEGEKIILRPLEESEAEQVCRWRNNPEISDLFYRKHIEPAEYVRWMREVEADPDSGVYAIVEKADSELLGTLAFEIKKDRTGVIAATLGIMIGESARRGMGYGSEAMELLCAELARTRGARKIIMEVYHTNTRAIEFYKKLGFKPELIVMTREIKPEGE